MYLLLPFTFYTVCHPFVMYRQITHTNISTPVTIHAVSLPSALHAFVLAYFNGPFALFTSGIFSDTFNYVDTYSIQMKPVRNQEVFYSFTDPLKGCSIPGSIYSDSTVCFSFCSFSGQMCGAGWIHK